MARTVEDAARCLGALTGVDPEDQLTLVSEGRSLTDYSEFLKKDGLKGKRIGLIRNSSRYSAKVEELVQKAVDDMASLGAEIVEVDAPRGSGYEDASFEVLLYEFRDGLNKYFA
jgi:amidase